MIEDSVFFFAVELTRKCSFQQRWFDLTVRCSAGTILHAFRKVFTVISLIHSHLFGMHTLELNKGIARLWLKFWLRCIIIYQMFLLASDWLKRVKSLNIP